MTKQIKLIETNDTQLSQGSIKGAMKLINAASRDLWQVSPANLVMLEGFNPRVMNDSYKAHIRSLADSMKAEGYYQDKPIAGYVDKDGRVVVRDGCSRLLAVNLANSEGAEIELVPVVVSQAGVAMDDLQVAFIKGNSGKPLTVYETGVVVKRLAKSGYEPEAIASRLDFSVQHVNNLLTLMASPFQLREMVAKETVSASLAIDLIAKHGAEKALEKLTSAAEDAKEKGKEKVTGKDIETTGKNFRKACKKQGESLFNIITLICETDCFEKLDQQLYDKLSAAMQVIESAEDRSEAEINAARAAVEAPDE